MTHQKNESSAACSRAGCSISATISAPWRIGEASRTSSSAISLSRTGTHSRRTMPIPAASGNCPRVVDRLACSGDRPGKSDRIRAIAYSGACRPPSVALHYHSCCLAGAESDLQGKQEEIKERDLSTYGFLGYPVFKRRISSSQTGFRAGRERPATAPGTHQGLARRFNSLYKPVFPETMEPHEVSESARHRRPEDEQELRQHHQPVRHRTGRATETQDDGHRPCPCPTPRPRKSGPLSRVRFSQNIFIADDSDRLIPSAGQPPSVVSIARSSLPIESSNA